MIKKIIFTIIALTILYFGYQSFNRLRYWDRSVQVFKSNSNQPFGRGGFERGSNRSFEGRNFGNKRNAATGERTARPDFGNLPDSIRQRFSQRQLPAQPDSLRQQNRAGAPPTFRGRGGFEGGGRQRGGFPQRRNVRLNTVYRFLAVFAALTVLTIYIDKTLRIQRKKRKLKTIEINK